MSTTREPGEDTEIDVTGCINSDFQDDCCTGRWTRIGCISQALAPLMQRAMTLAVFNVPLLRFARIFRQR